MRPFWEYLAQVLGGATIKPHNLMDQLSSTYFGLAYLGVTGEDNIQHLIPSSDKWIVIAIFFETLNFVILSTVKVKLMWKKSGVTPATLTREVALTWIMESQRWIVQPSKDAGLPRLWTLRVLNGWDQVFLASISHFVLLLRWGAVLWKKRLGVKKAPVRMEGWVKATFEERRLLNLYFSLSQ